jgi:hypothetical protein
MSNSDQASCTFFSNRHVICVRIGIDYSVLVLVVGFPATEKSVYARHGYIRGVKVLYPQTFIFPLLARPRPHLPLAHPCLS